MTYIKNLRPSNTLKDLSSHESLQDKLPELSYFRVLESIVYVLIYEGKRERSSEKFVLRALRGKIVGFDGHTIYRVYVKEQKREIRVKDLRISEDIEIKGNIALPDYEGGKSTFQDFLLDDNNKILVTDNNGCNISIPDTPKKTKNKQSSAAKFKKLKQNASLSKANTVKPEKVDMVKHKRTGKVLELAN